ncbi:hypothetical protein AgCh_032087 [Apium graveolens]
MTLYEDNLLCVASQAHNIAISNENVILKDELKQFFQLSVLHCHDQVLMLQIDTWIQQKPSFSKNSTCFTISHRNGEAGGESRSIGEDDQESRFDEGCNQSTNSDMGNSTGSG